MGASVHAVLGAASGRHRREQCRRFHQLGVEETL